MLEDKVAFYKACGKMLKNTPAGYKGKFLWLKEVDSLALANVQLHLERAYKNFFKNPDSGYPKFKSKHHSRRSYTTNVVNGNIQIIGRRIKLPKLTPVRIVLHREIPANHQLKSVTVSQDPSGKYYASLLYAYENQVSVAAVSVSRILGIDFAMSGMAVCSDGSRGEYPMYYKRSEARLKKAQRKQSKCVHGSRNYEKQKRKTARCHEKIRNQRTDFHHKLSHQMAKQYDVVCVEDLDMRAMSGSMGLGKGVMDNGYGSFCRMLDYKLKGQGKRLIKVDRYYPSSKTCSCCGKVKPNLKLSERIYECECGHRMDRDLNAAINIREEGKRKLSA